MAKTSEHIDDSQPLGQLPNCDYRVIHAKRLIDRNPRHDWTEAALANSFELSRSHFSRIFNRWAGCSVPTYVSARRVDLAKRLLCDTNLPVKAVAFQCGFCHESHLIRVFRSAEGLTPRGFRIAQASRITPDTILPVTESSLPPGNVTNSQRNAKL